MLYGLLLTDYRGYIFLLLEHLNIFTVSHSIKHLILFYSLES